MARNRKNSHLMEKVLSPENIELAINNASKGKWNRCEVMYLNFHKYEFIQYITDILSNGLYQHGTYKTHYVYEPKLRKIQSLPFLDRVVQHMIYNIIYPIFDATFDKNTFSCRKGYGTLAASNKLQKILLGYKQNGEHPMALCIDIHHFFYSMDKKILWKFITDKIHDKRVLDVLYNILDMHIDEPGIPIGNLTSQLFANLYLSKLTRFILDVIKPQHSITYMDNFIILDTDQRKLKNALTQIRQFVNTELHLELNEKMSMLTDTKNGVAFVGYMHFGNKRLLLKHYRVRLARYIKKIIKHTGNKITISDRDFYSLQSIYGHILCTNELYLKLVLVNILNIKRMYNGYKLLKIA